MDKEYIRIVELNSTLRNMAKSLGACDEGMAGWNNADEQTLINRYLHFIDFAIEKDFPSCKFIKANFSRELLHKNNIYVDDVVNRRNPRQIVVINGRSTGIVMYDGFTTADVYVRHESDITIDCKRMSKVFVNVYDNAKVRIICNDDAQVYAYIHGDRCQVETEGEVKVRKESK